VDWCEALATGLNDVIPLTLLRGFTPHELCRSVCGVPELDPKVR